MATAQNTIEIRILATGADQAAKVLQGIAESGAKVGSFTAAGASQAEKALNGLTNSAKRVLEVFTGFSLANIAGTLAQIGLQAYEAGKQALIAEAAFEGMTQAVGVNGRVLLQQMTAVSRGLADQSETMLASARALQQSLRPDQLVSIMALATERAKLAGKTVTQAYNDIADAIAQGNVKALQQYNIVLNQNKVFEEHARKLGTVASALTDVGRGQAVFEASMEKARQQAQTMDTENARRLEQMQRRAQATRDFFSEIGAALVTTFEQAFGTILDKARTFTEKLADRLPKGLFGIGTGGARAAAAGKFGVPGFPTTDEVGEAMRALALVPGAPGKPVPGQVDRTEHMRKVELPKELALIKQREQAHLDSFARIEGAQKTALARNEISERDALAESLGRIDELERRMLAFNAQRVALAKKAGGEDLPTKLIELETEAANIRQKAVMDRQANAQRLTAIEAEEWAHRQKLLADESSAVDAANRANIEAMRANALERIQLTQTEGEALIAQVQAEARARITALATAMRDEEGITEEFQQRKAEIEANTALKIKAIREKIVTEDLLRIRAALADMLAGQEEADKAAAKSTDLWADYSTALGEVERDALAVGETLGSTLPAKIRLTEAALKKAVEQFGDMSEEAKTLKARLDGLKQADFAQKLADDLASVERQAALLGPDFDAVGARLDVIRRKMLEAADPTKGLTANVAGLKAEYERLTEFVRTRSVLEDVFSSAGDALAKLVEGVLLGTRTMGEAFADLGRAIVTQFVQRVIQEALNPLVKAAAGIVAGLLSSGGGGGGGMGAVGSVAAGAVGALGAGAGAGGSVLDVLRTANSVGSGLVSTWETLTGTVKAAIAGWDAGFGGISGAFTGVKEFLFGGAVIDVGSELGPAFSQGALAATKGLSTAMATFTAAAAAVGIALTAMRTDITDAGKAIQTSLMASAAAVAIFGGPYGPLIAAGVALVSFLLDIFGVFEKASKDWLSFGTRLSDTLGKEQVALEKFGQALTKSSDLSGVARSIEDFRHEIEETAGVGGFFKTTEGLGLFRVPGIPGATGKPHEGGISFNFTPFILEIQAAIDKVLAQVRDTLTKKIPEAAAKALPEDIFAAFKSGTIDPLLKEFNRLTTSTTATTDELKAFEEEMAGVGQLLTAIAATAAGIDLARRAAEQGLPADLFAELEPATTGLRARLVELAKSGKATEADFEALNGQIEILAGTVQSLRALRDTESLAGLMPELAAGVRDLGNTLQGELVALANSGTATAADLAALTGNVNALATGVILYRKITDEIAALSGELDGLANAAIHAVKVQRLTADEAIADARHMLETALTGPEIAGAMTALETAIVERYTLEKRLIEEIQARIATLLDTFGKNLLTVSRTVAEMGLRSGDITAFKNLLFSLEAVQQASTHAAVRLWAAASALDALVAAIPAAVEGFGKSITDPGDITRAIYTAALPSLTTLANEYGAAIGAGNREQALAILDQGATAITALGNAAIAGIEQWRDAAITAAHDAANAQVEAIQAGASEAIDAIREETDAKIEANNATIEGLREQREAIQENTRATEDWGRVVDSITKSITDLMLGTSTPLNPAEALAYAQANLAAAEAAFAAGPTAERAMAVEEAIQGVLAAGQNVFTRPSPEWRALFNAMIGKLETVKGTAAGFVTPEEAAAQSLESIDAEIKRLTDDNEAIREAAETQITAIEEARDAEVAAVRKAETETVKAIEAAAEQQIQGITAGVADVLGQIAAEQARLTGELLQEQIDLLDEITGGIAPDSYLAIKAKETVDLLKPIREDIHAILTGTLNPPMEHLDVSLEDVPEYQHGTDYTPGGLAILHRGEAVLTPADADRWRQRVVTASESTAAPVTVAEGAFVVNITGSGHPEEAARLVRRELLAFRRSLTEGPMRYRMGLDKVPRT